MIKINAKVKRLYCLIYCVLLIPSGILQADEQKLFFQEIIPYAEFANAIYEDEKTIKETAKKYGYNIQTLETIKGLEVSFLLAANKRHNQQIIAVRGTANIENALVDMNIKLLPDKITGQNLHQGFAQAATKIYKLVKPHLNKSNQIATTGHSLGGAVAQILAMQLDSAEYSVYRVVTFGQPKVTNVSGAKQFAHLNVTRLVRPKDLVPMVPPLDPLELKNIDIYWHLGEEILLLGKSQFATVQGLKAMQRSMEVLTSVPNQENMENHAMASYLALVVENSHGVSEVEYKSSFNPLGLFGQN